MSCRHGHPIACVIRTTALYIPQQELWYEYISFSVHIYMLLVFDILLLRISENTMTSFHGVQAIQFRYFLEFLFNLHLYYPMNLGTISCLCSCSFRYIP